MKQTDENNNFDNCQESPKRLLKQLIEMLRCASLGDDDHICREPITLSCGHYVCKQCIAVDIAMFCRICGEKNKANLAEMKESSVVKLSIQTNIDALISMTKYKFRDSLSFLQSNF